MTDFGFIAILWLGFAVALFFGLVFRRQPIGCASIAVCLVTALPVGLVAWVALVLTGSRPVVAVGVGVIALMGLASRFRPRRVVHPGSPMWTDYGDIYCQHLVKLGQPKCGGLLIPLSEEEAIAEIKHMEELHRKYPSSTGWWDRWKEQYYRCRVCGRTDFRTNMPGVRTASDYMKRD